MYIGLRSVDLNNYLDIVKMIVVYFLGSYL